MISGKKKEKKKDLCRYLMRVEAASPSGVWIRYSSSVLYKSMINKAFFRDKLRSLMNLRLKKWQPLCWVKIKTSDLIFMIERLKH